MKFFRRKVQRGQRLGRKLGFPTINLRVGHFGEYCRQGVHHCTIFIGARPYSGLLYLGPKLTRRGKVLEIYLHRFSGNLYGQWVRFSVGRFLRAPQHFTSVAGLKRQMQKDLLHLTKRPPKRYAVGRK